MGRVEELSFSELVRELSHFEHESGPPDLERAIRRRSIDARLMRLLSVDAPIEERRTSVRVPGELPVKLHVDGKTLDGTILDLGEGGIRVHLGADTLDADADAVEVELDSPDPQHACATAQVQWKRARGSGLDVGLHFAVQAEAHRRRMRRLILEILRRMPDPA
jgi:hypothetical protein